MSGLGSFPMKTLFICGGSASGKTYLARMIQRQIGDATLLSQDAFYCDRPSGSAADRHEFDFDQPGAIDWAAMMPTARPSSTRRPVERSMP